MNRTSAAVAEDAAATVAPERSAADIGRALVELAKPGVTRLVLVTTGLGVIAAPMPFRASVMASALGGTALVVAGANALNMFLERDSDRFMTRTKGRPLPTGRLLPEEALSFGVIVSILGLSVLAEFTSLVAVALAALALLSYVLIYTPMKRFSTAALYVGAVPGALPPAIGYTAAAGGLDRVGWCLFFILFVWQIPHFIAISLFRREEYARAGLQVLPNVRGVPFAKRAVILFALALTAATLLPFWLGVAGPVYGAVALLSGLLFTGYAATGFRAKDETKWARTLFFASMPHLVLVMSALVLSVV